MLRSRTSSSTSSLVSSKLFNNDLSSLEQDHEQGFEKASRSLQRSKSESDKISILNNEPLVEEDVTSKSVENIDTISLSSHQENNTNKSSKRGRPKGSKNYSKILIPSTSRITRSKKLSTKQILSEFSESLMSLVKNNK